MATTVLNSPDEFHSAHLPSIWDFTSNRDRAYVRGVVSVTNVGGFARFTTSFAHGFVAGDIIEGSSFTQSAYNVVATITAATSTTITTNIVYVSNAVGIITRRNNNFKIKANVRAFNGDFIEFTSVASHISGIELTCTANHGLDGSEIILIDNSENYDGIYTIELLTSKNKIVINTSFVDDDSGSVRTSELIGSKESQAVSANILPFSVTTVGNNGGKAEYTFDVPHTFSVGDLVNGVGFTVGGYNGEQTIISVPSAVSIVTTATYSTTDVGVIYSAPYYIYRFNFSGILLSQLYGNRFDVGSANIQRPSVGNVIPYAIYPQEIFDDEDGLTYEVAGDLVLDLTDVKKAMNTAVQNGEAQNLTVFTQENSSKQMLTDSPRQYMTLDEEVQLYVQTDLLQVNIRAERWDNTGASLGETSVAPALQTLGNVLMMPINTNLFSASVSRIEVWLRNSINNAQISEKKSIYRRDGQCNGVRFHFLNVRGGYDQYTATGQIVKSETNGKILYRKSLPVGISVSDRGLSVISSKATTQVEAWTDYLNSATATWLKQLISSSDVYVVENGDHVPVVVTSDSVIVTDSEDMVRMKIAFVYANDVIVP